MATIGTLLVMTRTSRKLGLLGLVVLLGMGSAQASTAPVTTTKSDAAGRNDAGGNKTKNYISEGFFVGGERTVTATKLKDIRRANSGEGFERVVFDLEPLTDDRNALPYFQVQPAVGGGGLVISIWGDVAYDFDGKKIRKAFEKSAHVKRLNVLPQVEDGLAIIELILDPAKSGKKTKFEVFRLTQPARIIVDIL